MDREEIVARLGLPQEDVFGLPLLTITGDREVLIENHQGLLVYDPECVIVKTGAGRIRIEGRGLILRTMDKEALLICGAIHQVSFAGSRQARREENGTDAVSRKAGE